MSDVKSAIFGCSGPVLTEDERAFFEQHKPWGFILFARNIVDGEQIRTLTAALRKSVGRDDAPIFLDQEGGRVQRLRPPLAQNYPPAATFGALYKADQKAGLRATYLLSRLHAFDLLRYGITADCLPVLDVPVAGAHDVIGDRAYAHEPEIVSILGRAASDGLLAGGVLPVIKHIPGHGRAGADSHFDLPHVDTSHEELSRTDFVPFKALADLGMAMTAHVIYDSLDPAAPATTSSKLISDIIRGEIGFDGLLMSDDVSMKALKGSFEDRTRQIFAAGCDIALHCNGVMEEMQAVISQVPFLAERALERAELALAPLGQADDADENLLRAEFASLVGAVA